MCMYTIYYIIMHYYLLYLLNICPYIYQMSPLWIPVSLRTAQYTEFKESDTRLKIWHWNSNFTLGINRKFLELWKRLDKETKCSLADMFVRVCLSLSLSLSVGSGLWGLLKACLFD